MLFDPATDCRCLYCRRQSTAEEPGFFAAGSAASLAVGFADAQSGHYLLLRIWLTSRTPGSRGLLRRQTRVLAQRHRRRRSTDECRVLIGLGCGGISQPNGSADSGGFGQLRVVALWFSFRWVGWKQSICGRSSACARSGSDLTRTSRASRAAGSSQLAADLRATVITSSMACAFKQPETRRGHVYGALGIVHCGLGLSERREASSVSERYGASLP